MDLKNRAATIRGYAFNELMGILWFQYKTSWKYEYAMLEGGKKCSWWRFNSDKRVVYDFSNKWRESWNEFEIVQLRNWCDFVQAVEWWEKSLWINIINMQTKTTQVKTIFSEWDSLQELSDKQKQYLEKRCIDYEKVKWMIKNFNWWIWCLVSDSEKAIGLWARILEWNQRFTSLAWYSVKGVYRTKLDKDKDYLIVVEWMFDFLSLRQYEQNVIGLHSAKNWLEIIKEYSKNYNIYFIPDNDDPWREALKELKDNIDINYLELDNYNVKDVNELLIETDFWSWIIDKILTESDVNVKWSAITALNDLKEMQRKTKERGKLWEDWPFEQIDKLTQWIIDWKVYMIWAPENVWKSKFSYVFVSHFLKKGKKVSYFSLEVDKGMLLWNIATNYYNIHWDRIMEWHPIDIKDFKNLKLYDDLYDMSEIEQQIEKDAPDYVFIDFVQNVLYSGKSEYEKMANVARQIQKIAIKYNTTIFPLSQLSNESQKELSKWNTDFVSLKWAWEFKASSDVIFILRKKDNPNGDWFLIELTIKKNKYWPWGKKFDFEVDFWRWQFVLQEWFQFIN